MLEASLKPLHQDLRSRLLGGDAAIWAGWCGGLAWLMGVADVMMRETRDGRDEAAIR